MPKRYPQDQRERAVRMVLDHLGEYESVFAACSAIGPRLNIGRGSLRRWVVQAQIDADEGPGVTRAEQTRIRELEWENRELREAKRDPEEGLDFLREGARPSPPQIAGFVDELRANGCGVEPACKVLREQGVQVAPRTYRSWKSKAPAARTVTDAVIVNALKDTAEKPESLYGRRKMTAWLRREGHDVARCMDRLMRDEAMNGLVQGRKPKASAAAKDSQRTPDLLNRGLHAARPNAVWVTDFTHVRTWAGFAYVAFAIDVISRAIVGWHGSTIKDTDMVLTTLEMALWRRDQAGTPVPGGMVHPSQ